MKKTHQDRLHLIDRLERKLARKMRLQNQARRQNTKSALRTMRGQRFDERTDTDYIDDVFRGKSWIAY